MKGHNEKKNVLTSKGSPLIRGGMLKFQGNARYADKHNVVLFRVRLTAKM